MDTKNNWMDVGEKIVYALLAALGSMVCVMGYYPLVPAIYASYCMDKRKNFLLYIGLFAGMGFRMPIGAVVKYLFVILVLGMAIRFYTWANRRCGGWTAGLIAGLVAAAMNCSGLLFSQMERGELVMGLCEGIMVCGLTVIFHYVLQMAFELCKRFWVRGPVSGSELEETAHVQDTGGRMYAFAEAMDELSVAFSAMGSRSRMSDHESVDVLQQEITGKLCAACDACTVCWSQGSSQLSEKIRQMLQAVVSHSPKEEILSKYYMQECPRYSGMVEEAIWAFSRMELNEAWYKRLQENRMVIAGQLDAMASAIQDWKKGWKNLDAELGVLLAQISYMVRERGLVADQVHIYEDEQKRRCITAMVSSKWGGGIPSKNYTKALEQATGLAIRLRKDTRSILTREAVAVTAYEDTCFYAISGSAQKAKEGASINGDNFSVFLLEDGKYYICLSDGMGSGPSASKESDMVVDLMEKFMEAGFPRDTAIRLMNSAMVLRGDDESYSTMDYGVIDLYTGELELTKIGAAASFVRHRQEVSCLGSSSLPAGADPAYAGESVRRKMVHGDFLVMVTDGVLEYLHVKNPEEKLAEMIGDIQTDNAGALARTLLEHVMLFTGGHAPDDMTIVVTGIWEK